MLIEPGNPWQNGTNESFNGKFRDECLNLEWFRHRTEAKVIIEQWRQHYNADRPHSNLGYRTPNAFKEQWIKEQRARDKKVKEQKAVLQRANQKNFNPTGRHFL